MGERDYEILVASFLLRDRPFAAQWTPVFEQVGVEVFFGHYALQEIVSWAIKYFKQTGELLSQSALKMDSIRVGNTAVARDTYVALIDEIFKTPLENKAHVETTLTEEAKLRALAQINLGTHVGNLEELTKAIRRIDEIGVGARDRPVLVMEGIENAVESHTGIPSGFPTLDAELTGHGVCPGELCVVEGAYGVGKTRFLCQVALNAAQAGYGVLYVTYEVRTEMLQRRMAKTALNLPHESPNFAEKVKELFGAPDNPNILIAIKCVAYSGYSSEKIEADIDKIEARTRKKIDLVIRDYGELEASETGDWRAIVSAYQDFKKMLIRRGCAGWDAMQKNRSGNASYFDIYKPVDIALNLERASDETATLTVNKNREGPRGRSIFLVVNTLTGRVHEREDFEKVLTSAGGGIGTVVAPDDKPFGGKNLQ